MADSNCNGNGDSNSNGDDDVDDNGNSNGGGRWQRRRRWPTAMLMADGNGNGDGDGDGYGDCNGNSNSGGNDDVVITTTDKGGLPLHVLAMCSTVAGATSCLPPLDTKECALPSAAPWGCHCKECLIHFKGGDPESSPWIGLFYFFQLPVQFNK